MFVWSAMYVLSACGEKRCRGGFTQAFVLNGKVNSEVMRNGSDLQRRIDLASTSANIPADVLNGGTAAGLGNHKRTTPRSRRFKGKQALSKGVTRRRKPTTPMTVAHQKASSDDTIDTVISERPMEISTDGTSKPRMHKATGPSSKSRIRGPLPARLASHKARPIMRLTQEDEARLTYKIRAYRQAVDIREELSPRTEDEWAQGCGMSVAQLQDVLFDGQDARALLIKANGALVRQIATKYSDTVHKSFGSTGSVSNILSLQDLIQEGNLGIMEAAERFEPERGFRFSTYATWWVRQHISQAVAQSARTIRLPASVLKVLRKMNKMRVDLESENGRSPTLSELSLRLNMPEDKIRLYGEYSKAIVSLEGPLRKTTTSSMEEDKRSLGDMIPSEIPTPFETAASDERREDILAAIDTLADRERDVLLTRFGFDDGQGKSMGETAKILGISQDRVRVLEARALNKLRHPQMNYRLKEHIQLDLEEPQEEPKKPSSMEIWSV